MRVVTLDGNDYEVNAPEYCMFNYDCDVCYYPNISDDFDGECPSRDTFDFPRLCPLRSKV